MRQKREIRDGCAASHAMDIVGERWALVVARELMLGPKRFTDLRAGLPGISPNVLTQRLEELEAASVLRRRKLPPPVSAQVYELTEWGLELEPVLKALGHWGVRSPALPMGKPLSVDGLIMSLRTMFDGGRAGDFKARIGIQLGEERFDVDIAAGQMKLVRGASPKPDAVLETDLETLGGLAYLGLKLSDVLHDGKAKVEGDRAVLKRFFTLFPLPEPAPVTAQPV
ncbi:MAG TPA: winged helix-turn-helix transcriptional regulator [Gammaproteobacteria bacterium]|nr:winged helix-turn-helix transcriptional regulator [Gammaproteobacteria bacterium]